METQLPTSVVLRLEDALDEMQNRDVIPAGDLRVGDFVTINRYSDGGFEVVVKFEISSKDLPIDRPHQFKIGDRLQHVDEAGENYSVVKKLTWRVRDGVRYPTYTLYDCTYREDVPDVLDTIDLVWRGVSLGAVGLQQQADTEGE